MNYPQDINNASWLSDDDRQKLLAVYESIGRNPLMAAIDLLNFGFRNCSVMDPFDYKIIIAQLMTVVRDKRVMEIMQSTRLCASASAETVLGNLFAFFDELDSSDFQSIIQIEEAIQYYNEVHVTPSQLHDRELKDAEKKLEVLRQRKSA